MKVKIGGETRDFRTLWREGGTVKMIDQRKLPHRFEIAAMHDHEETAEAIRNMTVRGAGAIGVAAAYGIAQAAMEAENLSSDDFEAHLTAAKDMLEGTRLTAVNLFHAVERCVKASRGGSVSERVRKIVAEADTVAEADLSASRRIGEHGSALIEDGCRLLTHCNAGALAFIDYGTALSPMRFAHWRGKRMFVFVDETRPRCQGAMLTAWELKQEGIPHVVIVDNAAGHFMRRGEVDLVIVGADRIAANGDVANKIGTYERAVLAHENGVPFYVAAPMMTFDPKCANGDRIEIEERGAEEVRGIIGKDESGELSRVLITEDDTPVRNPAFDVTPADYVTGFVTELGVLEPPFSDSISSALREAGK
jgi:S-methyl-5-thioribose-1-phosphate isomerase